MFESLTHTAGRRGFVATVGALALAAAMGFPSAGAAFAQGSSDGSGGSATPTATATPSATTPTSAAKPARVKCAQVDWGCRVQGEPQGFDAGDAAGYRVWHNQNEDTRWHVETTDPKGVSHEYTGVLRTDGKFVNVTSVRPENADKVKQVGDGEIQFAFTTYSGIDGVAFSIDGGTRLSMDLKIDGQRAPTNRIFIGHKAVNPKHDPFSFRRRP